MGITLPTGGFLAMAALNGSLESPAAHPLARRAGLAWVHSPGRDTNAAHAAHEACLPTSAPVPPSGPEWLHEIKHDGYRMLAHHDGERVRLISRRGLDWGDRFPSIVAAVEALG